MDGIDLMGFHDVGPYEIKLNYTDLFFAGSVTLAGDPTHPPLQAHISVKDGRVEVASWAPFKVPKKVVEEAQELANRMLAKVESMRSEKEGQHVS